MPGHGGPRGGSPASHRRGTAAPVGGPWPQPSVPPPWQAPARQGPTRPGAAPRFIPAQQPGRPLPGRPHPAAGRDRRPAGFPGYAPPASRQAAVTGDAVWIPAGQSAYAGGQAIPGGLIYAGSGLATEKGGMPEPALIDPGLPVDLRMPDYAGTKMDYWPSYSSIAPECRAAYLLWLLDGRRAPGAYIGYVFLYFYGLERRLLVDSQQSPAARAEHPALVREVERLLRIYGGTARSMATPGTCSASCRWLAGPGGTCPRRRRRTTGGSCRSSCVSASASSRPMAGRCLSRRRFRGCGCTRRPGCGRRRHGARRLARPGCR